MGRKGRTRLISKVPETPILRSKIITAETQNALSVTMTLFSLSLQRLCGESSFAGKEE
jgi:hypothetical protein